MAYVKLDTGVLDSTLWVDREAREVFITALLMAVPFELTEPTPQIETRSLALTGWQVPSGWYGKVEAAGPGIVRRALVEPDAGMDALERLALPDLGSRTQDFDGRRLVRVDGGYIVLNFMKYRDRDPTNAVRQKRYRERKGRNGVTPNSNGVIVTQAVSSKQEAVSRKHTSAKADVVPADAAAAEFGELTAEGRQALEQLARASRNPTAWVAEVRATLGGMRGKHYPPDVVSRALWEMTVAAASPTAAAFRAFLKRAGPDDAPPAKPVGKIEQGRANLAAWLESTKNGSSDGES